MKYIKVFEEYKFIKVTKLVEDYLSKLINWDMIKDIKDMSLEYLDEGYELMIWIYNNSGNEHQLVYFIGFSHSDCEEEWQDLDHIFKLGDETEYRIRFRRHNGVVICDMNDIGMKEFNDRIKAAYPNENIKCY